MALSYSDINNALTQLIADYYLRKLELSNRLESQLGVGTQPVNMTSDKSCRMNIDTCDSKNHIQRELETVSPVPSLVGPALIASTKPKVPSLPIAAPLRMSCNTPSNTDIPLYRSSGLSSTGNLVENTCISRESDPRTIQSEPALQNINNTLSLSLASTPSSPPLYMDTMIADQKCDLNANIAATPGEHLHYMMPDNPLSNSLKLQNLNSYSWPQPNSTNATPNGIINNSAVSSISSSPASTLLFPLDYKPDDLNTPILSERSRDTAYTSSIGVKQNNATSDLVQPSPAPLCDSILPSDCGNTSSLTEGNIPKEKRSLSLLSTECSQLNENRTEQKDKDKGEKAKRKKAKSRVKYNCHYCSKQFSRPSSLTIHTYTHTGEKPHECSYHGCNRRFSVLSNLRRHMTLHSMSPEERKSRRMYAKSKQHMYHLVSPHPYMFYAIAAPTTDIQPAYLRRNSCPVSVTDKYILSNGKALNYIENTPVSPESSLSAFSSPLNYMNPYPHPVPLVLGNHLMIPYEGHNVISYPPPDFVPNSSAQQPTLESAIEPNRVHNLNAVPTSFGGQPTELAGIPSFANDGVNPTNKTIHVPLSSLPYTVQKEVPFIGTSPFSSIGDTSSMLLPMQQVSMNVSPPNATQEFKGNEPKVTTNKSFSGCSSQRQPQHLILYPPTTIPKSIIKE